MTRQYTPRNGDEETAFLERWCYRCTLEDLCPFMEDALALEVADPECWQLDADGRPFCEHFQPEILERVGCNSGHN